LGHPLLDGRAGINNHAKGLQGMKIPDQVLSPIAGADNRNFL
jgi:hypothetical protein